MQFVIEKHRDQRHPAAGITINLFMSLTKLMFFYSLVLERHRCARFFKQVEAYMWQKPDEEIVFWFPPHKG